MILPALILASLAFTAAPALAAPISPTVTIKPVGAVTSTTALLSGTVNPNASPTTTLWNFQYSKDPEIEGWTVSAVSGMALASEEVAGTIEGLQPGASYQVRLVATNEEGGEGVSPEPNPTFTTLPEPPTVVSESESANEVTDTSAELHAQINPGGGDTTYRLEYGPTTAYGTTLEGNIGSGITAVPVAEKLQGLSAGTTYHYLFRAYNSAQSGGVEGQDRTFTTQTASKEFLLPDDRAWEQVTPTDKHGASIEAITREGGVIQANPDGSGIAYVASSPVTESPEGNPSLAYASVLATRQAAGVWANRDLSVPHEQASGFPAGHATEYAAFNPQLTRGIVEPRGNPPLSPTPSEKTVFLRENLREPAGASYTPLINQENTTPGTIYGNLNYPFVVASSDLEHVILRSKVTLTGYPGASGGFYEWTGGVLTPVSILPDSKLVGPPVAHVGGGSENVRDAVSMDGDRVFWAYEGDLYVREVAEGHTLQLDVSQGGSGAGSPEARFQYATPDGERVYFTDTQQLTSGSTAEEGAPELYEYDLATGRLRDLTPDVLSSEGIDVRGEVIGASDNGEYVYFVAYGALTPAAEAHVGEPNLYVEHIQGETITPTLIATLSSEDFHDWEGNPGINATKLQKLTSRMSPNGRFLAFMSALELTGYDNHDAASGEPDEEVFLYDTSSGRLVCASCNPTGERPHGVQDLQESGEGLGLLVDRPQTWENRWLAGSLPGYTANAQNFADYQSRYLSDEGRLFFDSADGLVPQDTNGKEDVYEYEPQGITSPEGKPDCSESTSSGSDVFVSQEKGCVGLISSGTSTKESAFLDASESGNDVFFLTAAPLSTADVDSSFDIYDAHACTTGSPCAATAASSPPPCSTAESCKASPVPQPAIFGSPASGTFSGAGNPAAPSSRVAVKSLTRAQKLAAALRTCRKRYAKQKQKRTSCEVFAKKKYGVTKKKAKRATNGRGARR